MTYLIRNYTIAGILVLCLHYKSYSSSYESWTFHKVLENYNPFLLPLIETKCILTINKLRLGLAFVLNNVKLLSRRFGYTVLNVLVTNHFNIRLSNAYSHVVLKCMQNENNLSINNVLFWCGEKVILLKAVMKFSCMQITNIDLMKLLSAITSI